MTQPLVSIIIPCYNTQRYVAEAIRSAIAQSYREIEIIVVDDGSTDDSARIIQSFADRRVSYVHQENQGLSAARNTGIRKAKGRYLCFLDADDMLYPDKTAQQVKFLEAHAMVDMVTGDCVRTDRRGRTVYVHRFPQKQWKLEELIVSNRFPVHCLLIRRRSVDRVGFFDEALRGGEDWDYTCRLLLENGIIVHYPHMACRYRLLPGSMSSNPRRQTEALLQVIEKTFNHEKMPIRLSHLREEALAQTYIAGTRKAALAMDRHAFLDFRQLAGKYDPAWGAQSAHELLPEFLYTTRTLHRDRLQEYISFLVGRLAGPDDDSEELIQEAWFLARKERLFGELGARRWRRAVKWGWNLVQRHPLQTLKHYRGVLSGGG